MKTFLIMSQVFFRFIATQGIITVDDIIKNLLDGSLVNAATAIVTMTPTDGAISSHLELLTC